MFGLKGGAVGVPRWIIIFRIFEFIFAVLVIALTAYALSIYNGGPLRTPLITMLVIAVLTLVPVLILVTPLHMLQRKYFDPRIALLLDGFALLYWTAAFTALASYQNIFSYYGSESSRPVNAFNSCSKCRSAWRSGVAATVFAALQILLFLFTTLCFIFYYHHHIAGTSAPGLRHQNQHTTTSTANPTHHSSATNTEHAGTGAATSGTTGGEHEMSPLGPQGNLSRTGHSDIPAPPKTNGYGGTGPVAGGAHATPGVGGHHAGSGAVGGASTQHGPGAGNYGHAPPYPESPTRP